MKSIKTFALLPAHENKATFVPAYTLLCELLLLIRVLLMMSTKVATWTQSGEGTMHGTPHLRTKVERHFYQFVQFDGNCYF